MKLKVYSDFETYEIWDILCIIFMKNQTSK